MSVQYESNVKNDLQRNNVFNSCNSTSTGTEIKPISRSWKLYGIFKIRSNADLYSWIGNFSDSWQERRAWLPFVWKKTIKTLGDWHERFLEKIYRLADPRKPVIAQKLNSYLVVWSSMVCSRVGWNADLYSWIGNFKT